MTTFEQECCARGQTAKVTVYAKCDCAACTSGARWFYCEKPQIVAEYMATPRYEENPDTPDQESVAAIAAAHPGCSLVYMP